MGQSESKESPLFFLERNGKEDGEGAISPDGMVMGTYLHGLFDLPSFRSQFLSKTKYSGADRQSGDYHQELEEGLDDLAEIVMKNLDMDLLMKIVREGLS
jgi:adenosylcobyric acid synthase